MNERLEIKDAKRESVILHNLAMMNGVIITQGNPVCYTSTKIREMVKEGDMEYKKLVPEKVASYIKEKRLY